MTWSELESIARRRDAEDEAFRAEQAKPKPVECVQCGARRKRGDGGKWWPTGAWSCGPCFRADFG